MTDLRSHDWAADPIFDTNTMSGHYVVKDAGTGNDARGQGTFTGVPGTGGAYEGAIHCD